MTPVQKKALNRIIHDSDLLQILIDRRPKLGGGSIEAKALAASVTEGWELCVQELIAQGIQTEDPSPSNYIDTSKLD